MFTWDENKRQSNLVKHRLDFADAAVVYENPSKLTVISTRHGEERLADTAVIEFSGTFLTLVYVSRGEQVRLISFRTASRRERKRYAEWIREQDGLGLCQADAGDERPHPLRA